VILDYTSIGGHVDADEVSLSLCGVHMTVVVYTVLGFRLGLIPSTRGIRSGDMKADRVRLTALRDAARKSVAAAARWWHYTLAAMGGVASGALLARSLAWLMA
jgi:hypothetical protein